MPDSKQILILDGALASELEGLGCDLRHRLWSARVLLEEPEQIVRVHRSYLEAGADCITTAGYQASVPGFMEAGLSRAQAVEIFRSSIRIALETRAAFCEERGSPLPLVAASLGPYGAYLADGSEYTGDYRVSRAELENFHADRIELTAGELRTRGGPDDSRQMLAFETIPSLEEALILARLLEHHHGLLAWMSFSCRDGTHTSAGDSVAECARALEAFPRIVAIGVNCTPPSWAASLLEELGGATTKRLLVYPNSGEVYHAPTRAWRGRNAPAGIAAEAVQWERWVRAGAGMLGGCCRTTPAMIRRLVRWKASARF